MIVISVYFTAGRYHSTPWGHHVNEGALEWPPSPWRLMRALIASWKLTMPAVSEERVLRLVSALSSPPDFRLPPAAPSHTRHYMPLYGGRGASRTLVLDSFIAVPPDSPVQFIWKADLEPESRELLNSLLANLSYFGRAESWCRAELGDSATANCLWVGPEVVVPEECDLVRALAPETGVTLEQLMVDTSTLRSKQKRLDPPGSQWTLYALNRDAFSIPPPPLPSTRMAVEGATVARYALDSVPLPLVTATVDIAELARRSIMGQYGRANHGQVSPLLVGRDSDSELMKGNKHAYYLPTDEDGDGRLDHLTVYISGGLTDKVCEALANTHTLKVREGAEIRLLLLGFSRAGDRGSGVYFGSSAVWRSATPFILSRHPKRYRSGAVKLDENGYQVDGAEAQILREWEFRRKDNQDLPEIASIERLICLREKGRRFSWLDFRRERSSVSAPSPAGIGGGFRITFASPTCGPIALGYGAHYGLGLFRPESEKQREPDHDSKHATGDFS